MVKGKYNNNNNKTQQVMPHFDKTVSVQVSWKHINSFVGFYVLAKATFCFHIFALYILKNLDLGETNKIFSNFTTLTVNLHNLYNLHS